MRGGDCNGSIPNTGISLALSDAMVGSFPYLASILLPAVEWSICGVVIPPSIVRWVYRNTTWQGEQDLWRGDLTELTRYFFPIKLAANSKSVFSSCKHESMNPKMRAKN